MFCKKRLVTLLVAALLCLLLVFLSGQFSQSNFPSLQLSKSDEENNGDFHTEFKRKTNEIKESEQSSKTQKNKGQYIPPRRVVHIDLKGAPPKISYLTKLFPIIKKAGGTDILLEYEDMFPHWGPIANISALNAYTRKEIEELLAVAEKNDLGVIPLVQTFGHLEFVLKLEEFQDLREVRNYPQTICPSNEDAWTTIRTMIDQILEVHPSSSHIHIGCDEVYQLGLCSACVERLSLANAVGTGSSYYDGRYIFLQHVYRLGNYLREQGKVPIIWDDMIRSMPKSEVKSSGIGDVVEPMVWVYVEDIDRFVDMNVWRMYSEVFQGVWAASAFKGAFGERLYSVNMFRHFQNNMAWLDVMYRESTDPEYPVNMKGILVTGWSRYDHFAVLCELLPVALPSLVLSLAVLTSGQGDIKTIRKVHEILQCSSQKSLMLYEDLRRSPNQWDLYRCSFPGAKAISLISTYNGHRMEIENLYTRLKTKDGWTTDWHVRHRFSSPLRVEESLKSTSYMPGVIRELSKNARRTLQLYYDKFTVEEWLEQHIQPLSEKMAELNSMADLLTKPNHWPRRPLQ